MRRHRRPSDARPRRTVCRSIVSSRCACSTRTSTCTCRRPSRRRCDVGASAHRATLGAARVALLVIGVAVLAACKRPASGPRAADAATTYDASLSPRADGLRRDARQQLADLRAVTAPYREVAAAKAAGFIELTGCMSDPAKGGMGVLYAMTSRFDGNPQHDAPEILVYASEEDGKL